MTSIILESTERPIASRLLEIHSIYARYNEARNRWVTYFIETFELQDLLSTRSSDDFGETAPIFNPREHARNTIVVLANFSKPLLDDIRGLESDRKSLFGDIARLEIKEIDSTANKGLFLLFSKAVEGYDASDSNGRVDE